MKKMLLALCLIGGVVGCTNAREATKADNTKVDIRFFEEPVDFSWETAWVDSLFAQIAQGSSGLKDADSTCFPCNREQLIKYLKFSKIANSGQGLTYVFVDLASNKIVDLTGKFTGKEFIQLDYAAFLKRWQAEEIVMKLIKKENLPNMSSASCKPATKNGDDGGELMQGEEGRMVWTANGECPVLAGRTTLYIQVHWYTGQALPGYTTNETTPSVKNSFSHISPIIGEGYHEKAATFIYNPHKKRLEGCIGGYVVVPIGSADKTIKITERITVDVLIDMQNNITCFSYN